jgi:hypothetical protein
MTRDERLDLEDRLTPGVLRDMRLVYADATCITPRQKEFAKKLAKDPEGFQRDLIRLEDRHLEKITASLNQWQRAEPDKVKVEEFDANEQRAQEIDEQLEREWGLK